MPHYARLQAPDRARLEQLVQLFVAEKRWEGLGGRALTDEIRATIAGQACLLLLGFTRDPERGDLYRNVKTVLVYPSTVVPMRVGTPIFAPMQIVHPIVPVIGEGQATFLDPYAGTSAGEFFAVATEHFFDQPNALRAEHPELYEVLRGFYRQDPAACWQ
jgi:Mlc titration factor MtfA (ptsG expression regulator)